jgi:uncharacterized protein
MRLVLDTNVLVSGIMNPHGPPGRILDMIVSQPVPVLYDDRILTEYRQVLERPRFGFDYSAVASLLDFIEFSGEHMSCASMDIVLPDPTDLPFLEVAITGMADALVTGNTKHFKPWRGRHAVRICSPAELLSSS